MVYTLPSIPLAPAGPPGSSPEISPPTPVVFPDVAPKAGGKSLFSEVPLVTLLQTIQRPADIQLSHFEALGIHVISDASPKDIIPDDSYLPPFEEWKAVSADDLEEATRASKRPLNNGNLSPGVQTYQERIKELSIDNTAAFRTIRRIPAPPGESNVRLGNAYEFFKNLEMFSTYWPDTSLRLSPAEEKEKNGKDCTPAIPNHLRTHVIAGTGSQLPAEYRHHLVTAFLKLVSYEFGCNTSFPRCEPRLLLIPHRPNGPFAPTSKPASYFNSAATFLYRTPTDRASARSGVVEGPVCALSCRVATAFVTTTEKYLDFAREVVAILLTAQQRARESQSETRHGQDKWWVTKPRWGGGKGGPIGREAETVPSDSSIGEKLGKDVAEAGRREIGGIGEPPSRRKKGNGKDGSLQIYENYRKLLPPSSTWDRKARYSAIGKVAGADHDDVFLVSALNHHLSVLRARVPGELLDELGGEKPGEWRGRVEIWRSKWFDLYLVEERIEAMELVWGMLAWLMRGQSVDNGNDEMDIG